MDVLFCTDIVERQLGERIREIDPDIDLVVLRGDERVDATDIERITAAFFSSDAWPDRAAPFLRVALDAPNLEWLHTMSAGVDSPVFISLQDRGVTVTTSSGASAPSIARTVMMYLLALSRDLPGSLRAQEERRWNWHRWDDLDHARLAVVGWGPIGREIARLGVEFAMTPTVVRRRSIGDEGHPTRSLDELADVAGSCDALVVALPLNADTRGIVSSDVIAALGPSAYFVNVGRGELVDQGALTDALAARRIGGAALDVFAVEPLPPDDPLWSVPNLIVTPHNSGSSSTTSRRASEIFISHLTRRVAERTTWTPATNAAPEHGR